MLSFFPDFQSVSDRGYGNNLATCPSNQQLLSCGLMNYQTNNAEWYRSAVPISSSQCGCYDYWGVYCVAWCTNVPINNFVDWFKLFAFIDEKDSLQQLVDKICRRSTSGVIDNFAKKLLEMEEVRSNPQVKHFERVA